ncbi:hypothetical protein L7F22_024684 [Adiantum nelumboides]|nr:hypothetical protein [Adiantum nelumboides]
MRALMDGFVNTASASPHLVQKTSGKLSSMATRHMKQPSPEVNRGKDLQREEMQEPSQMELPNTEDIEARNKSVMHSLYPMNEQVHVNAPNFANVAAANFASQVSGFLQMISKFPEFQGKSFIEPYLNVSSISHLGQKDGYQSASGAAIFPNQGAFVLPNITRPQYEFEHFSGHNPKQPSSFEGDQNIGQNVETELPSNSGDPQFPNKAGIKSNKPGLVINTQELKN